MRKTLTFIIIVLLSSTIYGQRHLKNQSINHFREFTFSQQSLLINGENGQMKITHYTPEIIRIRASRSEISDGISYAVVREPTGKFGFSFNSSVLVLTTDSLKIEIEKYPLHVKIFTKDNHLITEHYFGLSISWLGDAVTSYHRLFKDEIFLGLGDQPGSLNRRGHYFDNRNGISGLSGSDNNSSLSFVPFFVGIHDSLVYGIFQDNTSNLSFDFGSASDDQFYSFSADDGNLDYYFIYGSTIPDIIKKYTHLTGRMELPPIWGLGYQHCRNGYLREKQVFRAAETFREKGFPIDLICLDMKSSDQYKPFTWHPERFSFPSGLTSKLKDLGIKTAIQMDPGIKVEDGYYMYDEGIRNDFFVKYPNGVPYTGYTMAGRSHFPDFTRPETRSWWSGKIKNLVNEGISSIWLGFTPNSFLDDKTPEIIEFDYEGEIASLKKAKNSYYLLLARSTYEGLKKALNGKRSFIISNDAYAGIQRYSGVWNGGLKTGNKQMLQGIRKIVSLGLSGIPFSGNDIGSQKENPSPELYLRWLNLGIYTPIFMNFSDVNALEQEPWSFGEQTSAMAREIMQRRYELLPYLYSSLYYSALHGLPLCQSLAIEHPFDKKIYNPDYENQFLFGKSMLVVPASSDERIVRAYLPEGEWYNPSSRELLQGPAEVFVAAPLDSIPVFIKGGSIIPMQSSTASTAYDPSDTLYLKIYYGNDSSDFIYYEDDGISYNYLKGNYYKRKIEFRPQLNQIHLNKPAGNFTSKFRFIKLLLHGFKPLKKMEVNLRKYAVDSEKNTQIIIFDNYQEDVFIHW